MSAPLCKQCHTEVTRQRETVIASRGPNLVHLRNAEILMCDCSSWFTRDFVTAVAKLLDDLGPAPEGDKMIRLRTLRHGGDVEVAVPELTE